MKINPTLLLFLFISNLGLAQLNLPLKFSGYVVKWTELQWMEGNKKHDQWFEYRMSPIIVDDTIYLLNNYRGLFDDGVSIGFNGYTIKKLNKHTGEKYWEVQRQYKEYLKRKAISQAQMDDGRLIVTLFDEAPQQLAPGTDWNRCYPGHIVVDRATGIVTDSNFVDRTLPYLPYHIPTVNPNSPRNGQIFLKDSMYLFRFYDGNMIDYHIDLRGNIVKSKVNNLEFKYKNKHFRHYNLNNEFEYVISLRDSADFTKKEFLFLKYEHDMNFLDSVEFSPLIDLPENLKYVLSHPNSGEYFFIVGNSQTAVPLKYESKYHMFDGNGSLIDRLHLLINGRPEIEYGWHQPLADVLNKRLLLTRSQQDSRDQSTIFDIYVPNGDSLRSIKSVAIEGRFDHFRTEYHQMLDNGDILLYISQFDWRIDNTFWFSWVLLDGKKMGIVSPTQDVTQEGNVIRVYPNPSSGIIHLDHLTSPAIVTVTNISGQVMKSLQQITQTVDISDLPAGMYIFDIKTDLLHEKHKVIKVE